MTGDRRGFTLVELLMVTAIIGVLASLIAPAARLARDHAHRAYCASQQRQLVLGNTGYANDHGGYVAAAADLFGPNRRRWHGSRSGADQPFCAADGPLAPYLGATDAVRVCPTFAVAVGQDGFEAACGGYGYNAVGIGSRAYLVGFNATALARGMPPESIGPPSRTLMFADTAFPQPYARPDHLIEYSFAEPYYVLEWSGPAESTRRASPSIHFRHGGEANLAWADGHVSAEPMTIPGETPAFPVGWFGEPGNDAFDLR